MIAWTYALGYFAWWAYKSATNTTLIGANSQLVAIAVATTLYGIGLGATGYIARSRLIRSSKGG